jgi:hypothetical protein
MKAGKFERIFNSLSSAYQQTTKVQLTKRSGVSKLRHQGTANMTSPRPTPLLGKNLLDNLSLRRFLVTMLCDWINETLGELRASQVLLILLQCGEPKLAQFIEEDATALLKRIHREGFTDGALEDLDEFTEWAGYALSKVDHERKISFLRASQSWRVILTRFWPSVN